MSLCFLRLHKWSKWSSPYTTLVRRPSGSFGDSYAKEIVIQDRICTRCDRIQDRVVSEGVRQE